MQQEPAPLRGAGASVHAIERNRWQAAERQETLTWVGDHPQDATATGPSSSKKKKAADAPYMISDRYSGSTRC